MNGSSCEMKLKVYYDSVDNSTEIFENFSGTCLKKLMKFSFTYCVFSWKLGLL
jgi:hypothetical protein